MLIYKLNLLIRKIIDKLVFIKFLFSNKNIIQKALVIQYISIRVSKGYRKALALQSKAYYQTSVTI